MYPEKDDVSWMARGSCKNGGPEVTKIFFDGSPERAKSICETCPVMATCGDYALRHEIPFGVWGGLSEIQRERMLKGTYVEHRCVECDEVVPQKTFGPRRILCLKQECVRSRHARQQSESRRELELERTRRNVVGL